MGPTSPMYILLPIYLLSVLSGVNALAHQPQNVLAQPSREPTVEETGLDDTALPQEYHSSPVYPSTTANNTFENLLYALNVMQDDYFELWQGKWPSAIDWTAAVVGTHVAATLSTLSDTVGQSSSSADTDNTQGYLSELQKGGRAFENLVNHFFNQLSVFYFAEDAIGIRSEAFDDMMWVVLEWLENVKFQVLHTDLRYNSSWTEKTGQYWHGTQFRVPAAHRSRLFYGLASGGWDVSLCGGGMIWNPRLLPYKNAITNELYISSAIGMYLYFPGDIVECPFTAESDEESPYKYPHDPVDLKAAIDGYKWFKNSNMTGVGGLYADGFHIHGYKNEQDPGTGKCDELNTMVYTYNQGVILSGLRGLWIATLSQDYLRDAHDLVGKVIRATGWPNKSSSTWSGLGRGGVLEDTCDSTATCSQNSHTFKGIFFHHLAELCRPLSQHELRFLKSQKSPGADNWPFVFQWHEARCKLYRTWIEHNANAALVTRNHEGKFGTWWGQPYNPYGSAISANSPLPDGAVDYRNYNGTDMLAGGVPATRDVDSMYGLKQAPNQQPQIQTSGDPNDRGRGRTVETQSGGVAVLRALYVWETSPSLS